MALEKEMAAYRAKLPGLVANEGNFVLIHGDQIVDTYNTYEDAIKGGYTKFGFDAFLVKQIHSVEPVHFISRLVPCHPSPAK